MIARTRLLLTLMLAVGSTGCRASPDPAPEQAPARLGLMTTLPIYWPEAEEFGQILQSSAEPSPGRQTLETRFKLEPLDTLEAESLRGYKLLLLAQPRVLSPIENVALDQWVRDGGRLLLFADPMLTGHSQFAIGDKRRAQDVVLLSPILTRWGLSLVFDPDQPLAERSIDLAGTDVPVALAGRWETRPGTRCAVMGEGVLAQCRIGRGSVTTLADAAVLENVDGADATQRRMALLAIAKAAFD